MSAQDGQPLGSSPYLVTVRDRTYHETGGSAAGYMSLDFDLCDPVFEMSTWKLRMAGEHPAGLKLFEDGAGIVIRAAGTSDVLLSGPVEDARRTLEFNQDSGEMTDVWEFSGHGDEVILAESLAFAASSIDIPTTASINGLGSSRDVDVPAETAILNVVRANISSTANIVRRRYPWLIVPASQGRGSTVTRSDRFSRIIDTAQSLGLVGGLTFSVKQSGPGQVTMAIRVPQQVSGAGWRLGVNVSAVTYSKTAPTVDEVIVGGGSENDGTDRPFTRQRFASSQEAWGRRREAFVDANEDTLSELRQAGTEELESGRATAGMAITPMETPGLRLGVHYQVGDIGTVALGTMPPITDRIRRVSIHHEPGRAPVVRPSVGAPDPDSTPAWLSYVRKFKKQLSQFQRR
jgi:hypothetical protein